MPAGWSGLHQRTEIESERQPQPPSQTPAAALGSGPRSRPGAARQPRPGGNGWPGERDRAWVGLEGPLADPRSLLQAGPPSAVRARPGAWAGAHLGHRREEGLQQGGHRLGALQHPGAAGHGLQQPVEWRQPGDRAQPAECSPRPHPWCPGTRSAHGSLCDPPAPRPVLREGRWVRVCGPSSETTRPAHQEVACHACLVLPSSALAPTLLRMALSLGPKTLAPGVRPGSSPRAPRLGARSLFLHLYNGVTRVSTRRVARTGDVRVTESPAGGPAAAACWEGDGSSLSRPGRQGLPQGSQPRDPTSRGPRWPRRAAGAGGGPGAAGPGRDPGSWWS